MRDGNHIWKGLVAGLAGGLAGSLAMNAFQSAWSNVSESWDAERQEERRPDETLRQFEQREQEQSSDSGESENATVKAANKISQALIKEEIPERHKQKAGSIVHYAFGTLMGGMYGAAAELLPAVRTGFGLLFGAALFVGADEVAVPALGLSKAVNETPLSTHLYALASHLVYGASTELVRRGVRFGLS